MSRSSPKRRVSRIGLAAAVVCAVGVVAAGGCIRVKVDPIYAKVDVNLKIDRSLDEFYSFQQPAGGATTAPSGAAPTTPGGPAVVVPEPTTVPVLPPTGATPTGTTPEGVR